MAKKDWAVRLESAYQSLGTLISAEAERLARATLQHEPDDAKEQLSNAMSLGYSFSVKKGTAAYAERKTRRAIVLLVMVARRIRNFYIPNSVPTLVAACKAAEKLKDEALLRRLQTAWLDVGTAQLQEVQNRLEATARQDRAAAERRAARRTNHTLVFEQRMVADCVALMSEWSVNPTPGVSPTPNFAMYDVADEDRVKSVVLMPTERDKRGALDLDLASNLNLAPLSVYFLPWGSKRITRMTIPTYTAGTPSIFFTSALSGCTVFVSGPADNPTVYHAGVDGDVGDDAGPTGTLAAVAEHWVPFNAVKFWRRLLLAHWNAAHPDAVLEGAGLKALVAEANKTMYIDDKSFPGATPTEEERRTTPHSRAFRTANTSDVPGNVNVETLKTWGTVFGVRDTTPARNWSFYLQENVGVTYKKVGAEGEDDPTYLQQIPIAVRKFYPKPAIEANVVYAHAGWDGIINRATAFTKNDLKIC